jgi:CRP-like cAMP-binding protein
METTDRAKNRGVASARDDADPKARILDASRLNGLAADSRVALLEVGRVEALTRRWRLLEQGEQARSLVVIGAGRVRIDRASGDRVIPLGQRGPGDVVGEAYVGGGVATESATVVEQVEALVVPLVALRKLASADAGVRRALVECMISRQGDLERRLASLLLHGVQARLCEFLVIASDRWGEDQERGRRLCAAFTHAEIAASIGSTRETVTLLLGKLRREDLIAFEGRRVVLLDVAALQRRAGGELLPE